MMNAVLITETYWVFFVMLFLFLVIFISNPPTRLNRCLCVFVGCLVLEALWHVLTEMALVSDTYPFLADRLIRATVARALRGFGASFFLYGLIRK